MSTNALFRVLVLLLVVASCAPFGRRGAGAVGAERVELVVRNQNFYQATIFAYNNGARIRLGEVSGNSTATLSAPVPPTGQLRVEVRLLAVGAFTSYPISVTRGDAVEVTVPPDLHRYRGRPR
jgi:hypothetical protein